MLKLVICVLLLAASAQSKKENNKEFSKYLKTPCYVKSEIVDAGVK